MLIGIAVLVALAVLRSGEIRERAEAGLGEGMPPREAALARGFVLGDDDELDQATKEDFIRAGLSHLTAVSGENVTLLALLAMPVLAMFGVPLRERLVWVIALIAVYVPLAGSGPSIQRAGVMGAAGLLATLTGRRTSRLYALGLAAVVTLAIDPSVAGNVGWQLSFAAVLGILVLAAPIRGWLLGRLGPGSWRRALAEGVAVTISATLATAPLIAYVFEEISLTSLAANVLVLPAVAPAMWLGMVAAALAQIPGIPLAPLNGLDALLLAYIAQVAAWCATPSWAVLHVHLGLRVDVRDLCRDGCRDRRHGLVGPRPPSGGGPQTASTRPCVRSPKSRPYEPSDERTGGAGAPLRVCSRRSEPLRRSALSPCSCSGPRAAALLRGPSRGSRSTSSTSDKGTRSC